MNVANILQMTEILAYGILLRIKVMSVAKSIEATLSIRELTIKYTHFNHN